MKDHAAHGPHHIPTNPDPSAFADWPAGMYEEMLAAHDNGCVGSLLVSETDRVRVWHLHIAPGERCGFHRHVNPYFWSSLTAGRGRNYASSGAVSEAVYTAGETRHYHYGPGDYMLHCIENVGDTTLSFVTVEFLDGTNPPLAIPDHMRLTPTP
ncbi:hypothetical protein SAMN04488003_10651 [Loktanella fryxellensis]|uniref:Cupin domain-containing protein n=1 Tax=Loktanella fryxellensis TaxID=245187 RepID=A0A1H8C443_9RHOB|nr:cupin domain-containing protein [Loktanella fryxellensis]SEM89816.1 hypothetical protein SAMN04488003_10651 [Loktanella fryxellensis]